MRWGVRLFMDGFPPRRRSCFSLRRIRFVPLPGSMGYNKKKSHHETVVTTP